jgi:undecaprenyl diphosphate synthase
MLMSLFVSALEQQARKLHQNNVRLRVIGDRLAFSKQLQILMRDAEALTADNTGLTLVIAANYGGRWDLTQAARALAERVVSGDLQPDDIAAEHLSQGLCSSDLPEPDLFIRTGGEQRVSNFLLWQLAYTELYFTATLWPDFDRKEFEMALDSYANRQRRFGRTGEQIAKVKGLL